jgi:nucleoside-diphosphate-sugar epimerase
MTSWKTGLTIYNYSDNPHLSSGEAAEIIRKALGKRKPLKIPLWVGLMAAVPFDLFIKMTGRNLTVSSARVKKFNSTTQHLAEKIIKDGFLPKYKNDEGLEKMVSWYLKQK